MDELENQIPQSEDEADALLSEINEPARESAVEPGAAPAQAATTAQAQQAIDFAFTVGGKEIKLDLAKDRDKLMRWAQQGYEAPTQIGELNKKLEAYTQRDSKIKELESKYGPVDEYIRKDPQWWDFVQNQYQQRQQSLTESNPVMQIVETLKQEVEGLKGVANTYQQREQAARMQQEDSAYQAELDSIQKQYPKIDFSSPDQTGKSLEYKVLEYARENGIKKFTTAFRDFHHEELLKLKEEEAKEKVINDKQSKSKLGILGISATPTLRVTDSVKGKSYADLEREALKELGLQ